MADDKTQKTPNRKAEPERIKVRVVKQAIRHEGRTYHGPSTAGQAKREADTFLATQDQIDTYGEKFVVPVEAQGAA